MNVSILDFGMWLTSLAPNAGLFPVLQLTAGGQEA